MKKIISCILILLMLVPITSCSSEKEKFVGEYTKYYGTSFYGEETKFDGHKVHTDSCIVQGTQTLVLNADGTGSFAVSEIEYADNIYFTDEELKQINNQGSGEVTWKVVDGYLSVDFVGTSYFEDGRYTGEATEVSYSKTYELKGDVLLEIDGNSTYNYKKIK